ncbi:hypothetical protein E2562_035362 [Oryza meyeriana var. granulata]|uniref:Uncharacterized protein n=1 Tax=Oryza meyeriana var. granulata TaxID=110450 RepID=A0A6G1E7K9_9ORYZ|nr:hypothetical protein E2562_035362 [Oryza meyeriana var. granulata]
MALAALDAARQPWTMLPPWTDVSVLQPQFLLATATDAWLPGEIMVMGLRQHYVYMMLFYCIV